MKQAKIIGILLILVVIFSAVWLVFKDSPNGQLAKKDNLSIESQLSSANPEVIVPVALNVNVPTTAQLIIDDGSGQPLSFDFEVKEETTAFSLLQESGSMIDYQDSDFGVFVQSIGDIVNGQDDKYWLYYLNGQMPMVAADKQPIKTGDQVEWKFEESQF